MPYPSEPDLLVLLGLRLRSFAPSEAVAAGVGLPEAEVAERLSGLGAADLALFRDGRMTGWMLTAAGRAEGERRLAAELDASGERAVVESAYRRFLTMNQRMLDVCTAWQLRTIDGAQVVNDHADRPHDAAAIADLSGLVEALGPVLGDLAEALDRFGSYGPRLGSALAKVQGGDGDWFTKPTIDSAHTIWFELHENLLATLGIERGHEPTPPREEAS